MMISKMSGQQSEGFTELEITYIQHVEYSA